MKKLLLINVSRETVGPVLSRNLVLHCKYLLSYFFFNLFLYKRVSPPQHNVTLHRAKTLHDHLYYAIKS